MKFNFNSLNLSCCGGNRYIFDLTNRLVDLGHKVIITHAGLPCYHDWYQPIKAEVVDCGFSMFERGLARFTGRKLGLNDQLIRLKQNQPDCDFNVASFCMTAYPTYESGKGEGLYLVQHYEPLFFDMRRELKFMAEATYSLPLKKLCVSQWLTNKVNGVFVGDGVDLNKFKPVQVSKSGVTVLGLDVKEEFKRPKLLGEVLRLCRNFSMIAQPSKVSDSELVQLYNFADCFVCTSEKEGFYLPALEAMACGCPVVSSPCAEYLENGINCLIVDSDNPADYALAVKRVLSDLELKTRLVKGGFETSKKFSFDLVAEKFLEAIKN